MVTVSNSNPNGILTMENVKDSLLNEGSRRKENANLLLKYLFMRNKKGKKNQKGVG